MSAVTYNPTVEKGATFKLSFNWYSESTVTPGQPGVPIDLTGCTARMQIRSTSGDVIFDATTENNKITLTPLEGGISVKMTSAETDAITVSSGKYDLEVEFPVSGDVYRLLEGKIKFKPNITRS